MNPIKHSKPRKPKQKLKSPLPMRDGVSASRVWLPKNENKAWLTVLDFLTERFTYLTPEVLQERMRNGFIVDETGKALDDKTPYLESIFLFYYREVPDEVVIPFKEKILYKDDNIIVVDKPHFIPITPTGRYVKETLLARLKHHYQIEEISPIHRLDKETAGIVMFTCNAKVRGAYQCLFQKREVDKTYEAIAALLTTAGKNTFPLTHKSRIVKSDTFFLMQEEEATTDKPTNSETHISIEEVKGDLARYKLKPVTGKQHQLRVHMMSLKIPILNDPFYPELLPCKGEDYSSPLQLLAKSITFDDPITGKIRTFESERSLVF